MPRSDYVRAMFEAEEDRAARSREKPTGAYQRPTPSEATADQCEQCERTFVVGTPGPKWLPGPARDVEPFFELGRVYLVAVGMRDCYGKPQPGHYRYGVIRFASPTLVLDSCRDEPWEFHPDRISWYMPLDALPALPAPNPDAGVTLED